MTRKGLIRLKIKSQPTNKFVTLVYFVFQYFLHIVGLFSIIYFQTNLMQ